MALRKQEARSHTLYVCMRTHLRVRLQAALSAGLKDLSRRVHSWTDGPPTPHSSRPRPSRPASARQGSHTEHAAAQKTKALLPPVLFVNCRVRGSSLSHRNPGDLRPSQGTLTSTAARLRLWREQSEHPRSRGRRKALSIKDQLEQGRQHLVAALANTYHVCPVSLLLVCSISVPGGREGGAEGR